MILKKEKIYTPPKFENNIFLIYIIKNKWNNN